MDEDVLKKIKDALSVESKELEKYEPKKHGDIQAVTISGKALTASGDLTVTTFFDNMEANQKDLYGDMVLTKEEAEMLEKSYKQMSIGINAVIPLICNLECPYKDRCPYLKMGKAPVGKPCKLENDLLIYHTSRFIREYNVNPNDHSEIMLIQELSELIILEMRVSLVLARPENADMFNLRINIAKDGTPVEEQIEHWAFNVKEKIKARRLKILDALNGTRKAKAKMIVKEEDNEILANKHKLDRIIDIIENTRNSDNIEEVNFEET